VPDVVAAPAKLTRSLRITGVRADGYHLVDAELLSIDLVDTLTFGPGDELEVRGGAPDVPVDDGNLVRRALRAVGRTARVVLDKRIPSGAGLGGGSADAAAVLRWAGVDDLAVAATLGADVPFCVRGGRARVTGAGEHVAPLDFEAAAFTLLTPPVHCSTPAVYAAWDALGGPVAEGANDLEPAALRVAPELARWRDELGDRSGEVPTLAGSGSTWFVPGAHEGPGLVVVRTLPPHDPSGPLVAPGER
jgi:4-diphosphocytidyl-2-C-methyl-D-erythritol kinase